MKFGAKIYNEKATAKYFENKADFLEVMALDGVDYSFLKNYSLPIVVHAMHDKWNVNPADRKRKKENDLSVGIAVELADIVGAKKIIFHPGFVPGTEEESVSYIKDLDKRIIVENMPPVWSGRDFLCSTPDDMKRLMKKYNRRFCFDIAHAIQSADYHRENFYQMIKNFVELHPEHYHLGGVRIKDVMFLGGHLSFEDSDMPLKEILKLIPNDAEISLEVSKDKEKIKRDLALVKNLIKG